MDNVRPEGMDCKGYCCRLAQWSVVAAQMNHVLPLNQQHHNSYGCKKQEPQNPKPNEVRHFHPSPLLLVQLIRDEERLFHYGQKKNRRVSPTVSKMISPFLVVQGILSCCQESAEVAVVVNQSCTGYHVNIVCGLVGGQESFQFSNGHASYELLESFEVVSNGDNGASPFHVVAVVLVVDLFGSEPLVGVSKCCAEVLVRVRYTNGLILRKHLILIEVSTNDGVALESYNCNCEASCAVRCKVSFTQFDGLSSHGGSDNR